MVLDSRVFIIHEYQKTISSVLYLNSKECTKLLCLCFWRAQTKFLIYYAMESIRFRFTKSVCSYHTTRALDYRVKKNKGLFDNGIKEMRYRKYEE